MTGLDGPVTEHETDECDVCGEEVPLDGENGIDHGGQILCGDCWDNPVKFRVTCEARGWGECDFEHIVERNELNRHQVRQNAQMHAKTHRKEKRVFEDEIHETTVEEIEL